jgi:uncharacterized membrane protein YkvA (DUF1232 family)
MDAFFSFLKVVFVSVAALIALVVVLLALPGSRLRSVLVEGLGWLGGLIAAALVVSPVDCIPDVIPVLGQADDLAYVVCAVAAVWLALRQRKARGADAGHARWESPRDVSESRVVRDARRLPPGE